MAQKMGERIFYSKAQISLVVFAGEIRSSKGE
jgi:hypothetical protein